MSSPYQNFEAPFAVASAAPSLRFEDGLAAVARSLNQPRTPLLEAFFAPANVDAIQNQLRDAIRSRTGYVIDRQSDGDLTLIMRKTFAENANHAAAPAAEVPRLNALVLRVVVPMVASGVAAYLAYVRDASRLPDPLPRPVQTSVKGTKTYELLPRV